MRTKIIFVQWLGCLRAWALRTSSTCAGQDGCPHWKRCQPRQHHNRAVAHFRLQHFAEAARDLEKCQQLGLTPHPELMQAVAQATGSVAIKD